MNITPIVNALLNEVRANDERHDDVDAFFAPSECHALVDSDHKHALTRIYVGHMITPTTLELELEERGISSKWIMQSGLDQAINYRG